MINLVRANFLSLYCIEYLVINQELQILEMSSGVDHFADLPDEVKLGNDVRLSFPELVGFEYVIDRIFQEKEDNFEVKGIMRSTSTSSPLYIDIYINKNTNNPNSNNLIIAVVDVTERMVMEKSLIQVANEANLLLRQLKASKQYTDEIIKSMADALLVTNLSGKIKTINLSAQALLECDEAELIGQHISIVLKEIENWQSEVNQQESIFKSPIKELETVCKTKSGKIIPIAFSCSMVHTEVENFQGYVYILRDISDRKLSELAKQEFLAMISHEIRTPITSVIGMASLLLSTELTVQQRDFVETIYTSGDSLHKIINDILDFSKIESGKLELEYEPFELERCMNEALYIVSPLAREKNLQLFLVINPEISIVVVGDITRLRQILVNLLSNAVKFTETGSIEVSAIAHQIASSQNGKIGYEIQFAVKDTGIGIPSDRLERLFKAFSQVNSSITRQYGGTGLGLAICKKLTESMGGSIWVESEPGAGSTFFFTITTSVVPQEVGNKVRPLENIIADAKIDPKMAEQYPLEILLVEDHVINQRMIRLMLQQMGYKADVAKNGIEALISLRRQAYNVVLMDLQMPEMDGITATKHICQEWPLDVRPKIIALTANAMWGDRDRCLASGMDDYLVKPIQITELMRVLQKCHTESHSKIASENLATQGDGETKSSSYPSSSIDPAALQEIFRMAEFDSSINAMKFLLEIIDDYLRETPRFLKDIQLYFSQANLKLLRRAAHTLSSTSATLGATTLANLCTALEVMVVTETLFGAAEQISQITAEYQLVQTALEQERQKYQDSLYPPLL